MDFDAYERELEALKARLAERDARIEELEDGISQAADHLAKIEPKVGEQNFSTILSRLQRLLRRSSPG